MKTLSTSFIRGNQSREILESVAQSLFTLTVNKHMIANVCLYLSHLNKIIYAMIKYTFQINVYPFKNISILKV